MKITAITHSKHRDAIGLVGISINAKTKKVHPSLVRQWSRDNINTVPSEINTLYQKIKWEQTYIDQLTGEHFINELKNDYQIPLSVINTKKNLIDPKDIRKIKTMDKVEMTQFMLVLKQNHQIEFSTQPSIHMKELEHQWSLFSEHKTEAGNVDYYSPGDELDNLIKSLMIACFAARNILTGNTAPVYAGSLYQQRDITSDIEEQFNSAFSSLQGNYL